MLRAIDDLYPGSTHVSNVGLAEAEDERVWQYARQNGLIIVSKDSDFHQRSFVRGAPPKVVFLRLGNCSTDQIIEALRNHVALMEQFANDPDATFFIIG